jgi:hypothetical protein
MNLIKTLTAMALGSALVAGCGAQKDEPAADTETPVPAAEAPADEMAPADTTDTLPADEADPAMSDSLPTAEKPPPSQPPPPPGG